MILNEASIAKIEEKAAHYPTRKSAILPALTIACEQVGHLNDDIYHEIARAIRVPVVEIAEAASFYMMFPKKQVGKYRVIVCRNISCALMGADNLTKYLENTLAIKNGAITPDRLFSLEQSECLGSCSTAPMMQINDDFYENLNRERVDQILEEKRSKA